MVFFEKNTHAKFLHLNLKSLIIAKGYFVCVSEWTFERWRPVDTSYLFMSIHYNMWTLIDHTDRSVAIKMDLLKCGRYLC